MRYTLLLFILYSISSYSDECYYIDDGYGNYAYVTASGSNCNNGYSKQKSSSPGFFGSLINTYFDDSDEPVKGFSMVIRSCVGKPWVQVACRQDIKEGKYIKGCEKDPICRKLYPNNLKQR